MREKRFIDAICNQDTQTALSYLQDPEFLEYFLNLNFDQTSFILDNIACFGNVQVLDYLLKIPAITNLVTYNDNRPLALAALNQRPQMVEYLLHIPAVVKGIKISQDTCDALRYAAEHGNLPMLKRLLQVPEVIAREIKYKYISPSLKQALDYNQWEAAYIIARTLWPNGQKQMWRDHKITYLDPESTAKLKSLPKKILELRLILLNTYNKMNKTAPNSAIFFSIVPDIWQNHILPFLYPSACDLKGFADLPDAKRVFFMFGLKRNEHFDLISEPSVNIAISNKKMNFRTFINSVRQNYFV